MFDPYSWWGKIVFDELRRYELIVSDEVLTEYLDVLQRPALVRKYRSVANRDFESLLRILSSATHVFVDEILAIARDHKDDHLLATAFVSGADFLVTEDNDLLVLERYGSTRIITAHAFLEELNGVGV